MIIIRVKDFNNTLGQILLLNRFLIITLVKGIQIELYQRLCIPDSQGIDNTVVVSHNRQIIRHSHDRLIAVLNIHIAPKFLIVFNSDITAEFDLLRIFRTLNLKWIAVLEPVIRDLYLLTVHDLLLKHTVFITNSTAVSRIIQCGQGFNEAGCQTAKAAIAKSRIRLLVFHDIDIQSHLLKDFCHFLITAEIDQIVAQGTAHQELHRQIINGLGILFLVFLVGIQPLINDHIL